LTSLATGHIIKSSLFIAELIRSFRGVSSQLFCSRN
jgi:hypothetical protein